MVIPCTSTHSRVRPAFTLVEVLLVLMLMTILITMMLPALSASRERSRAFGCMSNLRSVAFDFSIFVDPAIGLDRGDDEDDPQLGNGRIYMETFQESLYGIDEFWERPGSSFVGDTSDLGVMGCPSVRGQIQLLKDRACRSGAVGPRRSVSYAANLRLDRPEARVSDQWTVRQTWVSDRILQTALVPLFFDGDGREAESRSMTPHYAAPPVNPDAPYGDGHAWFPGMRHLDSMHVAFSGGEVLRSTDPLSHVTWRWDYRP